MARNSKIIYNPELSIKENAERNGVSISGVNYYIRTHKIDRRYDRSAKIIADCRKYYRSHKSANKGAIAKATGYSRNAVNKYWEYITTDAVFSSFNAQKEAARIIGPVKVKPNRKELMSRTIQDLPSVLEQAEKLDIVDLSRFLAEEQTTPFLFIGSGGMQALGEYAALMYGMLGGIGKAITPYDFASLSDRAIQQSRCVLLSTKGRNQDIMYVARRCLKVNPGQTACITFAGQSELVELFRKKSDSSVFVFDPPKVTKGNDLDHFISFRGKFYMASILYRAYAQRSHLKEKIVLDERLDQNFTYRLNKEGAYLPSLRSINTFFVVYGSYGHPAAVDIQTFFTEVGLTAVLTSDYRSFCHGRFIFAGNHTENAIEPREQSDVAMVMLVSPREESICKQLLDYIIPDKTPIVLIKTDYDSPLATMDLMAKCNAFATFVAENYYGENPNSPSNYSGIDKRFPISKIRYVGKLKEMGVWEFNNRQDDSLLAIKRSVQLEQENTNSFKKEHDLKGVLGSCAGDIMCSKNEAKRDLLTSAEEYSDYSCLTVCSADWLTTDTTHSPESLKEKMVYYGGRFKPSIPVMNYRAWLNDPEIGKKFDSCESAVMSIPVGLYASSFEEAESIAKVVASVMNNTPQAIKASVAVACITYLCRDSQIRYEELFDYVTKSFGYYMGDTYQELQEQKKTTVSSSFCVPVALRVLLDGGSFEESAYKAAQVGGDRRAISTIVGGIVGAFTSRELPSRIEEVVLDSLPEEFKVVLDHFARETSLRDVATPE